MAMTDSKVSVNSAREPRYPFPAILYQISRTRVDACARVHLFLPKKKTKKKSSFVRWTTR